MSQKEREKTAGESSETRRTLMKTISKAALAAPPAVTMILAATSKSAKAGNPYGNGKGKGKGKGR